MRMKGKISTESSVQQFIRVMHTISKINKEAVLRWAQSKLYCILTAKDIADGSVKVWGEINLELIFESFNIESKHEANEILMEINLENLVQALRSAQSSDAVTVKLTKKHGTPFLTLDIEQMSSTRVRRTLVQDVPVVVLRHELSADYQEPSLPQPEVNIFLPSLKLLRGIVDRMKSMSQHIILSANHEGELHLAIETDNVTVRTVIRELENPSCRMWPSIYQVHKNTNLPPGPILPEDMEDYQPPDIAPDAMVSARIDIKKFAQFLYSSQINAQNVVCSIVEHRAIIFFILSNDISLTYYVPVIL